MKRISLAWAVLTISSLLSILEAQAQSIVTSYMDSFAAKNVFNGNILIERSGKVIYKKSFGFADLSFKIPNSADTKFKIASITKAFTAVLTLQLVEQGKLDLDAKFQTYLPQYKGPAGNEVTVRQLLNMTTGLRNMDENASSMADVLKNGIPQYQLPNTSDQMLEKFCSDSLLRPPGKEFDYNNADYIILGKIIEKITGKPFAHVLQQNLLDPLHMKNSGIIRQGTIVDKLASTYFYPDDNKVLSNDLPVYIDNWYAAGAMYSTANDLMNFSNALFNGRLLKSSTLKDMFVSGLGEYGLGVWVYLDYEINKKRYTIIKRPGSIMGAQAMLFHILGDGTTIIFLSNTGTVSLDELAARLAEKVVK